MSYLTYQEYTNMGGTLSESDFTRYEFRAEKLIDEETYKRISQLSSIPDEVKNLTFELVTLGQKSDITNDTVSSEQVGSWHRTFKGASQASYTKAIKSLIRTYLTGIFLENGVPLLYRGID